MRPLVSASRLGAFAEQARRFCRWATGEAGEPLDAAAALRRIALLYSAALALPPPFSEGVSAEVAEVNLPLEAQVAARIGGLQPSVYWVVFDPLHDPAEEPVCGSIADDIRDIYRDVARGLALFEMGQHAEARWEWGCNFRTHWGAHATGAMRALHAWFAQEDVDGLSPDIQP